MYDTVGVDVEGHLDLRHATRCRRNVGEIESARGFVVRRHFALALEDVDRHRGLIVIGGRERLALLGRDRRVAFDQLGHDAAQGLDTERQRGDVEQQDILDFALQHAGLDRRADGHDFVGVDAAIGSLPKNCLTVSVTLGIRVMPPTRITSLISDTFRPASLIAVWHGSIVLWIRSSTSGSNLARVSGCLGASGRARPP